LAHEVMQMSVHVITSSSGYSLADMRQVKSSNVWDAQPQPHQEWRTVHPECHSLVENCQQHNTKGVIKLFVPQQHCMQTLCVQCSPAYHQKSDNQDTQCRIYLHWNCSPHMQLSHFQGQLWCLTSIFWLLSAQVLVCVVSHVQMKLILLPSVK